MSRAKTEVKQTETCGSTLQTSLFHTTHPDISTGKYTDVNIYVFTALAKAIALKIEIIFSYAGYTRLRMSSKV